MALSFLDLYAELVLHVADYLAEEDIASLMATCRSLNALLCNAHIWQQRYLQYANTFTFNSDFTADSNPSWRLLTVDDNELHDQLFYSVDSTGQRGFHPELKAPDATIPFLAGGWRQALTSLLDRRCEHCRAYCGTVHVMRTSRVCDRCAHEVPRYAVVGRDALTGHGLPEEQLQALPSRSLTMEGATRVYYSVEQVEQIFNLVPGSLAPLALTGR